MKPLLICLLMVPFISQGQINRSATELAKENIQEYLHTKILKDQPFQPVFYGQLKTRTIKDNKEIAWSLEHRFVVSEIKRIDEKTVTVSKPYKFVFFLDRRMEVLRAESAYAE
jgi:hypothetical protein